MNKIARLIKWALKALLLVIVMLLIGMAGGVWWLSGGERDISWMNSYFSGIISKNLGGMPVSINELKVGLSLSDKSLYLKAGGLALEKLGGGRFIDLSGIRFRLRPVDALQGRIGLEQLVLDGLEARITRDREGQFFLLIGDDLGKKSSEPSGMNISRIGFLRPGHGQSKFYVDSFSLSNGALYYEDLESGRVAALKNINLTADNPGGGNLKATASAQMDAGGENGGQLQASIEMGSGSEVKSGAIDLLNVRPDMLAFLPEPYNRVTALQLPISGRMVLGRERKQTLPAVDFDLKLGEGIIKDPALFSNAAYIKSAVLRGRVSDGFTMLRVDEINAGLKQGVLLGNASLANKSALKLELNLSLKDSNAEAVAQYWPAPARLAPHAYEWVKGHLRSGKISQASLQMKFDGGAKAVASKLTGGKVSALELDAKVSVDKVSLTFMPDSPLITNASGVLKFTPDNMVIDVKSAEVYDSVKISDGHVSVPDFHAATHIMKIDGEVSAKLAEATRFLQEIKIISGHAFLKPQNAGGDVEAKVNLSFPLVHNAKAADYKYDISGRLRGASLANITEKLNARQINGDFKAGNADFKMNGNCELNGVPLAFDLDVPLQSTKKYDFRITAESGNEKKEISELGLGSQEYISGKPDFKLQYTYFQDKGGLDINADLKDAVINYKPARINKPKGDPAVFSAKAEISDKTAAFKDISLKGEKIDIQGAATLDTEAGEVVSANLTKVRYGENNITLKIQKEAKGVFRREVQGEKLDIRPYLSADSGGQEQSYLKLDVKEAIAENGGRINNLRLSSDCKGDVCHFLEASGTFPDGRDFKASIKDGLLKLDSNDAGYLLKAMDVYKDMAGGEMNLTGKFKSGANSGKLDGRMKITNFRLRHTTFLAKLLSVASLTGILDGLNSSGISFAKLDVPFTKDGDRINFSNLKVSGPSIGMAGSGSLNNETRFMNIEGAIVPAYVFNTLIDKVPLIGSAISGGKGRGIFAFSFRAKGSYDSPEVSVNPLSVVTPGFLRDIFGVFRDPNATKEPAPDEPFQ